MSIMLDDEPRIKNGVYSVIYHSHYFCNKFGRDILVLQFQLAEINEEHKHSLFSMWLNIKYFHKTKNGQVNWSVKKKQKLATLWVKLFPHQTLKRFDRLPLTQLKDLILQAKIKEGTRDSKQKIIPLQLRVSKIVDLKLPDSLP